jgi:ubiquitin-protein ligase
MVAQQLQAAKRLRKELQNLKQVTDDDICLSCQDHLLRWKAWIRGPDDTPYAGGVFELSILCSSDYPLAPPTIKFMTKVCTETAEEYAREDSCPSLCLCITGRKQWVVVYNERECIVNSYIHAWVCSVTIQLDSVLSAFPDPMTRESIIF